MIRPEYDIDAIVKNEEVKVTDTFIHELNGNPYIVTEDTMTGQYGLNNLVTGESESFDTLNNVSEHLEKSRYRRQNFKISFDNQ